MSHIPFSKTSPRKKRRESPKTAVAVCVRAGHATEHAIVECAKKRNGPWNKRVYSRSESAWVQKAWKFAQSALRGTRSRTR